MDTMIFDIGCHNGQDSKFYLKKGFRVVAVEANPILCSDLKQQFSKEMQEGRFVLIERAIAEDEGEISFFVHKEDIWSTIRKDVAQRHAASDITEIRVPTVRLSNLIESYGVPHYLKIDIEGADHLCLEDVARSPDKPKYISTEIEQSSWREFDQSMKLLKDAGYRKFAFVDQALVPQQRPPQPPREGQFSDHQFELGSAGLFGAEIQAPWVSASAIMRRYLEIYGANKMHGLLRKAGLNLHRSGSWYDIHAVHGL